MNIFFNLPSKNHWTKSANKESQLFYVFVLQDRNFMWIIIVPGYNIMVKVSIFTEFSPDYQLNHLFIKFFKEKDLFINRIISSIILFFAISFCSKDRITGRNCQQTFDTRTMITVMFLAFFRFILMHSLSYRYIYNQTPAPQGS